MKIQLTICKQKYGNCPLNLKKTETCFDGCLKCHFLYCSQLHKLCKILCRICFLDIRTGTFKRICVWFAQNF